MSNVMMFDDEPQVWAEGEPRSDQLLHLAEGLFDRLPTLPLSERVDALNQLREMLHERSPFKLEPVDCVRWVRAEQLEANDYNPNSVAPPEMKLLEHSVTEDGFTQPIVAWEESPDHYEVVDGFHRNRVAREVPVVAARLLGYMPVSVVNQDRLDRGDRIAATIRHNRARGKHRVGAMADIVVELKRRNWSDAKIGRELGMDPDEVLRLSQISGLAEMFANHEFSEAWEAAADLDVSETDDLDVSGEVVEE